MLRSILDTLRRTGIDVQSRHRRDAADPITVQGRLLAGQDVKVVLDCGAHHGRVAREYKAAFPNATVHCFEPTPATFKIIQTNLRGLPGFEVVNAAVGAQSGTLDFFMVGDEQCNSLAKPEPNAIATKVQVLAIDDYCAERNITHIDALKMDIQGYEYQALKGMSRLLKNQAIDVICSEYFYEPPVPDATEFIEIATLLRDHGYRLFGTYGVIFDKGLRSLWGDAIFVSDAHLKRYQQRTGTLSLQDTIRTMLNPGAHPT